ncbi:hypothetical protein ACFU6R_35730 [Streptomyces sp. NPDC057499]|uniref:hypothetical protein n=1 Tax=Streptomyces sp. NPDC057499 TaxID=3346150 RepID=UPI0036909A08
MTTERYAEQFLLHALDKSGGSLNEFLNPDSIMGAVQHGDRNGQRRHPIVIVDKQEKDAIVSLLVAREYVSALTKANGSAYLVKLTGNGLKHARELLRRSQSKIERETHLHNVLVRWAYEHAPAGGSASLQLFAGDEHWWFAGTEVTWDEVFAAAHFLEAEGLLRVDQANGFARVQPTPLGTKFAHSKQTLRTFMMPQPPQVSEVTNNYTNSTVVNGNAPGSNFATGEDITQAINHGVDADALTSLVAQLRGIAPTLELAQEDAEDLSEEIDALEGEGSEPARGRRIMRRIARIIVPAAVGAGSDAAVQAAIAAGTGLFS